MKIKDVNLNITDTGSPSLVRRSIRRHLGGTRLDGTDDLAVEEPLEIRLEGGEGAPGPGRPLSITMRTPGQDEELAAGFLFTEGIVRERADLQAFRGHVPCARRPGGANILRVVLAPHVRVEAPRLERNFTTTSSCGVCGKASIEALRLRGPFPHPEPGSPPFLSASLLPGLPAKLREAQAAFEASGGLHACGLFDASGDLLCLREDVGRHNAMDKVLGRAFLDGRLPLASHLLLVSGRASFELVQKAAMAGVPCLLAVGAPSSLAVELAEEAGMTLVGWLRDGRFNVYTGSWRIL